MMNYLKKKNLKLSIGKKRHTRFELN